MDRAHTVMRRVFEGGEGCISGGRLERSKVREFRQGFCEGLDEGESGGEAVILSNRICREWKLWLVPSSGQECFSFVCRISGVQCSEEGEGFQVPLFGEVLRLKIVSRRWNHSVDELMMLSSEAQPVLAGAENTRSHPGALRGGGGGPPARSGNPFSGRKRLFPSILGRPGRLGALLAGR